LESCSQIATLYPAEIRRANVCINTA
jgi:hypothetical protein